VPQVETPVSAKRIPGLHNLLALTSSEDDYKSITYWPHRWVSSAALRLGNSMLFLDE